MQAIHGTATISSIPGLSPETAIKDCYDLKSKYSRATSGFYWVIPMCVAKPLRVYCDISSGATFATIADTDGIISVRDAVSACSSKLNSIIFTVNCFC